MLGELTRTLLPKLIQYHPMLVKYEQNDQIHVEKSQECNLLEIKKSNAKKHIGFGGIGVYGQGVLGYGEGVKGEVCLHDY